MTPDHDEGAGNEADDPEAFAGVDVAAFAVAYAHWLDHEGGREKLERDAERTSRETDGMVRRLASPPRGLDERF
jgi:hypothetical protein